MSKTNKLRPSPSLHASEQNVGTIKTGNDKNKWIVLPTSTGVLKWTKLDGSIKKYKTHWNGEHPYLVIVASNTLIVLKSDKLVLKVDKYKNLFVGANTNKFGGPYKEKFTGSSILIEIKPKEYIFIGKNVYKFTTTRPITIFYSIMGNSDVPYPFAISEDKIYLLLENVYINSSSWDGKIDPYLIHYNFKKTFNVKSTKYATKLIDKNL